MTQIKIYCFVSMLVSTVLYNSFNNIFVTCFLIDSILVLLTEPKCIFKFHYNEADIYH